jgi:hypothetical protein
MGTRSVAAVAACVDCPRCKAFIEKCGEGLPSGFFVSDDNLHVDLDTGGFYLAEKTFGPTTTCPDCKRTYAVEQMGRLEVCRTKLDRRCYSER